MCAAAIAMAGGLVYALGAGGARKIVHAIPAVLAVLGTPAAEPLPLPLGGGLRVGADQECDIVLRDPAVSGQLEHWQFDTFLCTWTDPFWDQSMVYFELDDAGKVSTFRFTVRPAVLDPLEYVFVKQPETR